MRGIPPDRSEFTMSAKTAPLHKPAELDFIGCDDTTGIAVF